MLEGVKVELNGREFIAPPVNLAFVRAHSDFFEGRKSPTLAFMSDAIFASLKRNYPDLTQDELEDVLDVGNMKQAFNAVMGTSGVEEKK